MQETTWSDLDGADPIASDPRAITIETRRSQEDQHLLIRWRCTEAACRDSFIEAVARRFRILAVYACEWSEQHWAQNLARLYGGRSMAGTVKLREIGYSPFLAVIVSDDAPVYGPCESMSGEVDVANRNIIDFKAQMRAASGGHTCHSTSSRSEFVVQSTLLLGLEEATRVEAVNHWDGAISPLHGDIEGADGWESFERLVAYLNRTCRWLVLRNFENLPDGLSEEKDLDVLTDDMELFAAIAGLSPGSGGLSHYFAYITGERFSIDVRCLGDGYYPTLWEADLLTTRRWSEAEIPSPDPIHHFFSLLYHARLHKPAISGRYLALLADLARQIRFDEITGKELQDDVRCASILSGFMKRRLYPVARPLDSRVPWNREFLHLMSAFELCSARVLRKRHLLRILRAFLPDMAYRVIPRKLRATVKNRLNH